MKFWESESFKKEEKIWLEKIKGEGFRDLEPVWNRDGVLNCSTGPTALAIAKDQGEYYRIASIVLHSLFKEGTFEYGVWDLFCEGVSERKIAVIMDCSRGDVIKVLRIGKKAILDFKEEGDD